MLGVSAWCQALCLVHSVRFKVYVEYVLFSKSEFSKQLVLVKHPRDGIGFEQSLLMSCGACVALMP